MPYQVIEAASLVLIAEALNEYGATLPEGGGYRVEYIAPPSHQKCEALVYWWADDEEPTANEP